MNTADEVKSAWARAHLLFAVLALIRFSIAIPTILIVTLLMSDQLSDALIATADTHQMLATASVPLTCLLTALTVWYTARTMLRFRFASNRASLAEVHPCLKRTVPRLLALLIPLALCIKTAALLPAVNDKPALWTLIILLLTVLLLVGLFVWLRRRLASWSNLTFLGLPEDAEPRNLGRFQALPALSRAVIVMLMLSNVFAVVLALYTPLFRIGAASLLLLALALITVSGSVIVYAANHYQVPVLTLIALWATLCSFFNDNHQVRQQPGDHSHGVLERFTPAVLPSLPNSPLSQETLSNYFNGWWNELAQDTGDAPVPVIIVAADGGGIRAAYWTAAVLASLQDASLRDRLPFARHVFAISGVSGGSLGAATFAAIAARRAAVSTDPATDGWTREATEMLGRDFLSPTLSNALFLDLPQRLLPVPLLDDRAVALEKSWESSWRAGHDRHSRQFSAPFQDLWRIAPHSVPLLFLNGTVVETGERAILDPLAATADRPDDTFANSIELGPLYGTDLPLSSAVLLSARFTYVSPAGLIGHPEGTHLDWLRIVDGGYFDNSGTVTAAEIAARVQSAYRARLQPQPPLRLIILHISNAPQNPRPPLINWARVLHGHVGLSETLAPVQTLLDVRAAHAGQASEHLSLSGAELGLQYWEVGLYQRGTDLPLGWSLSSEARGEMDQQLTDCHGYGTKCAATVMQSLRQAMQSP